MKTLSVSILPRRAPSKRLQYEKETKASNPLRLLLVEVLHGSKALDNEEEELIYFIRQNILGKGKKGGIIEHKEKVI